MTAVDPLPALLRASASFADSVLDAADKRLRECAPIVVVTANPDTARLLIEAQTGDTACLTSRPVPVALEKAVAVFLIVVLAQVDAKWHTAIAIGACRASVVVRLAQGSASLIVDEGGLEPRTLAVLTPQEELH